MVKLFGKILIALIALEMISWIGYSYDDFKTIAFFLLVILVFVFSLKKLEYGVYAVFAELVIGSQGYILSLPLSGFNLSLRLALFLALFLAFIIWVLKEKKIYFYENFAWQWYIALITFLGIGVIIGYLNGNSLSNIFFDWNGYLFFGLIFPITQAIRNKKQVRILIVILLAGVALLAIKTIFILFLFSHIGVFENYLPGIYRWIRDFRIGEITLQNNGFYRIFFQSHIYILYTVFIALAFAIQKYRWQYILVLGTSITLIFLSYSRSFWVAAVFILGVMGIYLLWQKQVSLKRIISMSLIILALFCGGYIFILGVVNMPLLSDHGSGVSASSLLSERTQDPTAEIAGGSRMELLGPLFQENLKHPLIGSGFGTTVTYASKDPRAMETSDSGMYTTFAFEWGYLDLWLKLGLAGTLVYLILLWISLVKGHYLIKQITNQVDKFILLGCMFGVISLIVVHALTPYLNHPLGIGWVILFTVMVNIYSSKKYAANS